MKALVHNGVAKFLLENTDTIEAHGSGIIIYTAQGQPDLIVGDIPFGEVEEVLDVNLPDFAGGKYAYDGNEFTLIEE
jgi:hypothetical protein